MPHDHPHGEGGGEGEDAVRLLEAAFIDGFRAAPDKASFLRLAGVPLEWRDGDGQGWKLLEVRIADSFAVGAATPGFATPELVYHPFPGAMIRQTTDLSFVYRTLSETRTLSWAEATAPPSAP